MRGVMTAAYGDVTFSANGTLYAVTSWGKEEPMPTGPSRPEIVRKTEWLEPLARAVQNDEVARDTLLGKCRRRAPAAALRGH
jgi:hypothetical protein